MQNFHFHGRKEKRGVHAVYSAVFRLCAAWRLFTRFSICSAYGAFSAAVSAEKRFTLYLFFCCNIYSSNGYVISPSTF